MKINNIVVNKEKQIRRKYSERGTRRQYATIKVDVETAEILKLIAERLEIPIVEAMRQAAERMQKDLANELG
jgi:hypothetical protein